MSKSLSNGTGRGGVIALPLALLVLVILALMGGSSFTQSSGTGRAYGRVVDMRLTIGAATAALAEAVTAIRESLDRGGTTPECPADWRTLVLDAIENRSTTIPRQVVVPRLTRELFAKPPVRLRVGDVVVDVVSLHIPERLRPGPGFTLPAGILQTTVTVQGTYGDAQVEKRVVQRRCFYASCDLQKLMSSGELERSDVVFNLPAEPLGTVIE